MHMSHTWLICLSKHGTQQNVVHCMLQTCSTYLNSCSDSTITNPIAANPQADTARGSQTNQPGLSTTLRFCACTTFPAFACEIWQLDCRVGHVNRVLSVWPAVRDLEVMTGGRALHQQGPALVFRVPCLIPLPPAAGPAMWAQSCGSCHRPQT